MFQQAYSCVVMTAEERLTAELLSAENAVAMGVDAGLPVMVAYREARDLLGRVVELRRCIYLTDQMYYAVEMS